MSVDAAECGCDLVPGEFSTVCGVILFAAIMWMWYTSDSRHVCIRYRPTPPRRDRGNPKRWEGGGGLWGARNGVRKISCVWIFFYNTTSLNQLFTSGGGIARVTGCNVCFANPWCTLSIGRCTGSPVRKCRVVSCVTQTVGSPTATAILWDLYLAESVNFYRVESVTVDLGCSHTKSQMVTSVASRHGGDGFCIEAFYSDGVHFTRLLCDTRHGCTCKHWLSQR